MRDEFILAESRYVAMRKMIVLLLILLTLATGFLLIRHQSLLPYRAADA